MRCLWILAVGSALLATADVRAQADLKSTIYYGVKLCSKCHGEPAAFENLEKLAHSDSVHTSRLLEYSIWSKRDKHKDAASALKNERSKQIAAIMKLPADLTNERRCANCHGVFVDPAKDQIDPDTFQGEDRLASGVSCVACHGPVRAWVREHAALLPDRKWSERSREDKKNNFGLRDLWNPVERAELCFSCHIGNLQEGKFVTHEMYAAGHPPLPSIELATFSDEMPAHWESLTQKAARARERGAAAKNGPSFLKTAYGVDANAMEMEQTRLAALTGMVALRRSIELMGHYAQESLEPKATDRPWPELAFYDCYACHHDLKSKSWRLEREPSGKPGRPTFRPWPYALARFGDRLLEPGPMALDPALGKWKALFSEVPFGDAKRIAAEAKFMGALLGDRMQLLAGKKFDRATAHRAALTLIDLARAEPHDFDSARQLAWSLRAIEIELQNDGAYGLVNPGEIRIKGPLASPFAALEKALQLRLPEGQVEIAITLDSVFGQISAYDPVDFRKSIDEIDKIVRGRK